MSRSATLWLSDVMLIIHALLARFYLFFLCSKNKICIFPRRAASNVLCYPQVLSPEPERVRIDVFDLLSDGRPVQHVRGRSAQSNNPTRPRIKALDSEELTRCLPQSVMPGMHERQTIILINIPPLCLLSTLLNKPSSFSEYLKI